MDVTVTETAVIRPVKPPFAEDHILSLSHLDTDRNLLVILRYLRVYPNNPRQQTDPFRVITEALSTALVPFYPFCGSLHRRISDGRLELRCKSTDGVPVINAAVSCPLIDVHFNHLKTEVDDSLAEKLAPNPDASQYPIKPISLQVTRFRCGGFVLGVAVHHAICDGLGATHLFSAMAGMACRRSDMKLEPVWERTALLGPRKPPRIDFQIQELLNLDCKFVPYSDSGKQIRRELFHIKEESLNRLKGFLQNETGSKFSTFEALGAFLWRARARASQIPKEDKLTFAYSINIRNIVDPPLPAGYWGNGCVPMYVNHTAQEVAEQPTWKTAESIKKSKRCVTAEYVSTFIDFQEMHYDEGINAGKRVSAFTDWRHLGHSAVDFGWGAAAEVVPLSRRLLGSLEPCFFLPAEEGLRILIHLEEDMAAGFRLQMEELENCGEGEEFKQLLG